MVERAIRVDFRWGDKLLVFEGVPASVCDECGEQSLRPDVYDRMARIAEAGAPASAWITVPVHEHPG